MSSAASSGLEQATVGSYISSTRAAALAMIDLETVQTSTSVLEALDLNGTSSSLSRSRQLQSLPTASGSQSARSAARSAQTSPHHVNLSPSHLEDGHRRTFLQAGDLTDPGQADATDSAGNDDADSVVAVAVSAHKRHHKAAADSHHRHSHSLTRRRHLPSRSLPHQLRNLSRPPASPLYQPSAAEPLPGPGDPFDVVDSDHLFRLPASSASAAGSASSASDAGSSASDAGSSTPQPPSLSPRSQQARLPNGSPPRVPAAIAVRARAAREDKRGSVRQSSRQGSSRVDGSNQAMFGLLLDSRVADHQAGRGDASSTVGIATPAPASGRVTGRGREGTARAPSTERHRAPRRGSVTGGGEQPRRDAQPRAGSQRRRRGGGPVLHAQPLWKILSKE